MGKAWLNVLIGMWLFLHGLPGIYIPANPFFLGCGLIILGIWSFKWTGIFITIIGLWIAITAYFAFMQIPVIFILTGLLVTILAIIHMVIS